MKQAEQENGNGEHCDVKKTPLYEAHLAAGGKPVDFHGWLLPIQYGSILQEHEAVRTKAGLFDVSHMGEIVVSGPDSTEYLQQMLTNDIAARPGKAVYSPMCYEDGGTVDDLIVYRLSDGSYLLVVNAANTAKDYQWLCDNKKGKVEVINCSSQFAQIAIQGPSAAEILQLLTRTDLAGIRSYHFIENVDVGGMTVLLSRTGYTGEDGFELYSKPEDAHKLWDMLLDKGSQFGLVPAGLGARDTLRLEASMPLYGQELSREISPAMAGLERFIKMGKGGFNGRAALLEQLSGNINKRIVGFEMIDRAVPRTGYEVYRSEEDAMIGMVTSGGFFPTLKKNMGLAILNHPIPAEGDGIRVKVRDGLYAAKVVKLPFYSRAK